MMDKCKRRQRFRSRQRRKEREEPQPPQSLKILNPPEWGANVAGLADFRVPGGIIVAFTTSQFWKIVLNRDTFNE
jgi:hypothetical protein